MGTYAEKSGKLKLTPKRRAWLEHLRDNGPDASHTPVGYACRSAGLSEWYVTLKDGREMPLSSAYALHPDLEKHEVWDLIQRTGVEKECITDAGREALKDTSP